MNYFTAIRELTTFDHAACDGVVCITAQSQGLIEYADMCRLLLHLP